MGFFAFYDDLNVQKYNEEMFEDKLLYVFKDLNDVKNNYLDVLTVQRKEILLEDSQWGLGFSNEVKTIYQVDHGPQGKIDSFNND